MLDRTRTLVAFGLLALPLTANAALVAHYDFNESAGPTLADSAPGAASLGTTSSVTFVASGAGAPGSSGFGNAGSFSASSSSQVGFGTASHPAAFDLGTGDFTVAGWFRAPTNTLGAERTLFQSMATNIVGGGLMMQIRRGDRSNAGRVFFTVGGTNFANTQAFSDVRLDDDTWHHVVGINSGGVISLYVDGVLQADGGVMDSTTTATAPATAEAAFGRFVSTHFDGQLDEWRIYNHALNAGEVTALYQQNVPEPTSLVAGAAAMFALARRRRRHGGGVR